MNRSFEPPLEFVAKHLLMKTLKPLNRTSRHTHPQTLMPPHFSPLVPSITMQFALALIFLTVANAAAPSNLAPSIMTITPATALNASLAAPR